MLGVGSGDRDGFGRRGAVGLVLFEAREAWEFVADFDYAVPGPVLVTALSIEEGCLLVGLEEEAVVAVIYYWGVFILSCFGGRELDMGEYPGLSVINEGAAGVGMYCWDLLSKRTGLLGRLVSDSRHRLLERLCRRSIWCHLRSRRRCMSSSSHR